MMRFYFFKCLFHFVVVAVVGILTFSVAYAGVERTIFFHSWRGCLWRGGGGAVKTECDEFLMLHNFILASDLPSHTFTHTFIADLFPLHFSFALLHIRSASAFSIRFVSCNVMRAMSPQQYNLSVLGAYCHVETNNEK